MEGAPKAMQEASIPLLRVSTFGTFRLAWQVAPLTEEAAWESRTSARTLFKLLLCAPGRQAPKSLLAGILWPEVDEERARESLRSACKVLRKVLRAASGEDLLEQRNNGEILRLAEQSRLWVDADTFEELVSQASRTPSPDAALALWEEANALLRGEFFADDQGSEWARHRLVKKRQQGLWLARCRMIRHLSDLYVQRGQTSLAEETLEAHLLHFPTDQDALYRLLLLLEQQGCFEQASILYERNRRTLEAYGKQPAHHVRVLYERFQQALSSHTHTLSSQTERPSPGIVVAVAKQTSPALSRGGSEDAEINRISTIGRVSSLPGNDGLSDSTLDLLRSLLEPEREGTRDVSLLSRRQLLELGIAAFLSRLAQLDGKRISAIEREALGRALGESVAAGWKLFHTASNTEVLAMGQLQLSLIHQAHVLVYPSTRFYLYAGAHGLVGLAFHLQERHEEALHSYHSAHLAAVATGDPWYIAQNLIAQADTYLVLGRYAEAVQALEEALSYLGDTNEDHRRAKAHLLGCWADVAMTTRDYSLAQKKLDTAADYLDHMSMREEFDRACWLQLAGKKAVMAGDYAQAVSYLEEALSANPTHWVVRHVAILIPLAIAYARMRERDRSLLIAKQTVPILGAMNAPMNNTYFLEYLRDDIAGRYPRDTTINTFLTDMQQHLPHLASFIDA
jgi:DNA-binding SARP family transcriptional activator